jgi:hypothetical protein
MCEFEEHDMDSLTEVDWVAFHLDEQIKNALGVAKKCFDESSAAAKLALVWVEAANELIEKRDAYYNNTYPADHDNKWIAGVK